jgi:hypothetical protein
MDRLTQHLDSTESQLQEAKSSMFKAQVCAGVGGCKRAAAKSVLLAVLLVLWLAVDLVRLPAGV